MGGRHVVVAGGIKRVKGLLKNGERVVVAEPWVNIVITAAGAGQNTVLRGQCGRCCGARGAADSYSDGRQGKSAESLRVMSLDAIQPGSDQYEGT